VIDINVPKLNNNDANYVLVEWLVDDGGSVRRDDPIAVIETSKAQEEIESSADGILRRRIESGAECRPGEVIGHVFRSAEELRGWVVPAHDNRQSTVELVTTNGARILIDEHGITDEQLRSLGKSLIRKADIEALIARSAVTGQVHAYQVPQRQRTVAAVVSQSARTIPAAAAYAKVDVEEALTTGARISDSDAGFVSLPELLVKAVALQHARFPLLFATLIDEESARLAPVPNIGVTIDAGGGLFVPVVRDAAALGVAQIGDLLMDYRVKALHGGFREQDLADANIMVALHNGSGVVLATPIVFPGQACVVSLGDTQEQLALDGCGQIITRRYVYVGLIYDHRLVNGRDAMLFLQELTRVLEAPAELVDQERC